MLYVRLQLNTTGARGECPVLVFCGGLVFYSPGHIVGILFLIQEDSTGMITITGVQEVAPAYKTQKQKMKKKNIFLLSG